MNYSCTAGGTATGLEHMKELAVFAAHVVDDLNTQPPAALSSAVPLPCHFRCTNAVSEFAAGANAFDCIHFGAATEVRGVRAWDGGSLFFYNCSVVSPCSVECAVSARAHARGPARRVTLTASVYPLRAFSCFRSSRRRRRPSRLRSWNAWRLAGGCWCPWVVRARSKRSRPSTRRRTAVRSPGQKSPRRRFPRCTSTARTSGTIAPRD